MGWNTGRLVSTAGAAPTHRDSVIQQLSGTMQQTGTPVAAPPTAYNAGSGITMPTASLSSNAIAGFVNNPGGVAAPATPSMPQPPIGHGSGGVAGNPNVGRQQMAIDNANASSGVGGANWMAAVQALGQPRGADAQPADFDAFSKQRDAILGYAKSQGMQDTEPYLQRLQSQGFNTYGGGDPKAAFDQYQMEMGKQQQVAQAMAGQGYSWNNPTTGGFTAAGATPQPAMTPTPLAQPNLQPSVRNPGAVTAATRG